jgi:hypothetical protein
VTALISGNHRSLLRQRGHDLYETPPEAVEALLRVHQLPRRLWEPACGPGAIVQVLRSHGHKVIASDLVDYGCPESESRIDFLMTWQAPPLVEGLITNPPFMLAHKFVAHALDLVPFVAMLLRLEFICGQRKGLLDRCPPTMIYAFSDRLPRMHRAGWDGPKASPRLSLGWFIWDRGFDSQPTELRRISWR